MIELSPAYSNMDVHNSLIQISRFPHKQGKYKVNPIPWQMFFF